MNESDRWDRVGIESESKDLKWGTGSELLENREVGDGQIGVLMIELKC